VERIVKDARRYARHEDRALSAEDLRNAVTGEPEEASESRYRSAIHESGHLILDVHHFGPEGVHAVLVRQADRGGAVWRVRQLSMTRQECANILQILLAGRAAEELVLGTPGPGSAGAQHSDLATATRLAAAMVTSLGFAGPHPLLYLGSQREVEELLVRSRELRNAVHEVLAAAYDSARVTLSQHRIALEETAGVLLQKRHVSGHEALAIIRAAQISAAVEPGTLAIADGVP
jgi:cell division protease FtsH